MRSMRSGMSVLNPSSLGGGVMKHLLNHDSVFTSTLFGNNDTEAMSLAIKLRRETDFPAGPGIPNGKA